MAPKKAKKGGKTTKEVATIPAGRRLAWGNNMNVATGSDQAKFIASVAIAYGVPSTGINIMGDKPYINKDGRLFLLHDFRKGKEGIKAIRSDFLKLSTNKDEPSICKVTIVFADGHEIEGIGEASKDSVKLEAVKQTLNMMAETRALNRAIWKEIAGDAWDRVAKNIARIKGMSDEEKAAVMDAGKVSAEEMERPKAADEKPVASKQIDLESNFRSKVESYTDVHKLIEVDEKLQKSNLYSDAFKKEMGGIIRAKVSSLEK